MPVSDTYLVEIKVLKVPVVGAVEHYHDNDYLGLGHAAVPVIIPFPVFPWLFKAPAGEHGIKNFAEFIGHYEYFSNFVFGEHSDKSIGLFLHYKFNTFIANHQIFNRLISSNSR